jgi:hypothetical protein
MDFEYDSEEDEDYFSDLDEYGNVEGLIDYSEESDETETDSEPDEIIDLEDESEDMDDPDYIPSEDSSDEIIVID